jgi:tRNA threonylcarbamoyl adenosine modification protein (Sua5/YciO/YrdC/YwlC family)
MIVAKYNGDPSIVDQAVDSLRTCGVVIYPTDTLYGMGCDAGNPKAISRVYNIKKLNKHKPLSLLCSDLDQVVKYAKLNNTAFALLKRLLPGPYTFILPATRLVPRVIMSPSRKVGIRIPNNQVCLELIRRLDGPLMNTSADYESDDDIFNDPQIIKDCYRGADMLIDCGPVEWVKSSVIDLSDQTPLVIRQGKGPIEDFICLD